MLFLDRHHVWQSHDQAFHFCEDVTPPFMFCIFFVQTHLVLSKLSIVSLRHLMLIISVNKFGHFSNEKEKQLAQDMTPTFP